MSARILPLGLVTGLLACATAPDLGPATPGPAVVQRRLGAMGTWLELQVAAPSRSEALRASEEAVRAIETVEARLSTWTDDSELARLNRAAVGATVPLSAELAADLGRARELFHATDGAFDPGVGPLVEAWGLRAGGRIPDEEELERALAAGGLAALELASDRAVRRHPETRLEEGAFGKGIGLDAASAALSDTAAVWAVIDLGGQVLLYGRPEPTRFGLADPRERERVVLELEVEAGSLATSASSERCIVVDGRRLSHILDPRTGAPAPDFGSVTVWAPDATTADALSTALFVMGPEAGLAWAERHPAIEAVVVVATAEGLRARATSGLRGRLRTRVEDLDVITNEKGTR